MKLFMLLFYLYLYFYFIHSSRFYFVFCQIFFYFIKYNNIKLNQLKKNVRKRR